MKRIVVVGSGTAAFNVVTTLAELAGSAQGVTLVSPEVPYARMVLPYYLSSQILESNVYTISPDRLQGLSVTCRFGGRATGLSREDRRLLLDDGSSLEYDALVVATGSSATRPPVPGIDGAHVYDHWTLADTQAIRPYLRPGARVAVVGGGFIGFTILNPLLQTGVELTVIEREAHVLPRMINGEAAAVVESWLREHGANVRTGVALQSIEDIAPPQDSPVEPQHTPVRKRLTLGDGQSVEADCVIVATGIRPNTDWLRESGLLQNGVIPVDDHCRTADPSIYAAGDVAEITDAVTGQRTVMAIETAAMEQGRVIGANLAGRERTYRGGMLMNVVEVAGLQAASFGNWHGDDSSEGRSGRWDYRKYVWAGGRLTGAVIIGPARQVAGENDMGMLKGLVQAGTPLGEWKALLRERPFEVKKAFLATRTVGRLLPQTVLGQPSKPLDEALAGVN